MGHRIIQATCVFLMGLTIQATSAQDAQGQPEECTVTHCSSQCPPNPQAYCEGWAAAAAEVVPVLFVVDNPTR
jgi:hypothetical protein